MNIRPLTRLILLGSLLIGCSTAPADSRLDAELIPAREFQQRMQKELQQRLDHRLSEEMHAGYHAPRQPAPQLAHRPARGQSGPPANPAKPAPAVRHLILPARWPLQPAPRGIHTL